MYGASPITRDHLIELYRQTLGLGESAATMASGAVAEPVAGLFGAYEAMRGGSAAGARDAVREGMTYAPRTQAGQGQLEQLGRLAQSAVNSAPVRTWQRGVDYAGRASPVAGATLQTVPTALGALTGYKQAMQTGNALSQRLAQAQRAAMENAMMPRVLHPQRGVFAGINAKTADLKALDSARKMLTDGVPANEVLAKTGWTIGADGRWRFEIDDSASYMRGKKSFLGAPVRSDASMGDLAGSGIDMQDVLQHQALFDAYPELKNTQVSAGRFSDRGGDYSPGDGSIRIADNLSGDNARSVMLHEIQHAIQEREGFASGGSAEAMRDVVFGEKPLMDARVIRRIAEKNGASIDDAAAEFMRMMGREPDGNAMTLVRGLTDKELRLAESNPRLAYMRLMGEVEARNVQARMNMGAGERLKTPPIKTEDYAREWQVRGNDAMMPRALHPQRGAVIVDGDLKRIAEFRKKDDVYQFENSEEFYRALNDFVEKNSANDAFEGMILPTGHGQHNGYLMITPSAKKEGAWQVTHTDKNYMPISDEGIQTKADALESFARYSNPELWHE